MGFPILVRWHLHIESVPRFLLPPLGFHLNDRWSFQYLTRHLLIKIKFGVLATQLPNLLRKLKAMWWFKPCYLCDKLWYSNYIIWTRCLMRYWSCWNGPRAPVSWSQHGFLVDLLPDVANLLKKSISMACCLWKCCQSITQSRANKQEGFL